MTNRYIRLHISREVIEEVESITGTIGGKVYYSDEGDALILSSDGTYIVSVEPPDVLLPGFNNGNPTTQSAYLYAHPVEHECPNEPGWSTGWEC